MTIEKILRATVLKIQKQNKAYLRKSGFFVNDAVQNSLENKVQNTEQGPKIVCNNLIACSPYQRIGLSVFKSIAFSSLSAVTTGALVSLALGTVLDAFSGYPFLT